MSVKNNFINFENCFCIFIDMVDDECIKSLNILYFVFINFTLLF